jgi:hypothetical protein
MDAMTFFQQSAGKWRSQRTTHHLAFRRAEAGESAINVSALPADAPEIAALCKLHDIDPALAVGGCCVTWDAAMNWDTETETHEGKTVFALIPDEPTNRNGRLLRDLGYAEIVPVVGYYQMDDRDGLVLTTDYETMSSVERFWFASADVRMRSSTVKRFGGLSTASFCTEVRVNDPEDLQLEATPAKDRPYFSFFGW